MSPKSPARKISTVNHLPEDLKSLDDKWAQHFARLEAVIFAKSFAVPVEPVVKSTEVITGDKPFFTLMPVPARHLSVGSQM